VIAYLPEPLGRLLLPGCVSQSINCAFVRPGTTPLAEGHCALCSSRSSTALNILHTAARCLIGAQPPKNGGRLDGTKPLPLFCVPVKEFAFSSDALLPVTNSLVLKHKLATFPLILPKWVVESSIVGFGLLSAACAASPRKFSPIRLKAAQTIAGRRGRGKEQLKMRGSFNRKWR